MSGEPATIVEKAVSTLKVRDLLRVTLTRWPLVISLTKTPLEDPRRSAAPARSAEPNRASAAPRTIKLKVRSFPPALLETRPPLIPFPFAAIHGCPRNASRSSSRHAPRLQAAMFTGPLAPPEKIFQCCQRAPLFVPARRWRDHLGDGR